MVFDLVWVFILITAIDKRARLLKSLISELLSWTWFFWQRCEVMFWGLSHSYKDNQYYLKILKCSVIWSGKSFISKIKSTRLRVRGQFKRLKLNLIDNSWSDYAILEFGDNYFLGDQISLDIFEHYVVYTISRTVAKDYHWIDCLLLAYGHCGKR
jgi:hypothetical protein